MPSWVIWVIVAIVVVAVIAAILAASKKKKQERDRTRASEIREEAAEKATTVQQREARAKETEAEAAAARAEADRKQAEAQRLEAEATERQRAAEEHRAEHQDHLRRADELDPDVDTKHDDYVAPGTEGAAATDSQTQGTGPRTAGDLADGTTATETHHEHGVDGHADGDRVHDRLGGQDTSVDGDSSSTATVTHPDGSTETVNDPASGSTADGGTHRA